MQRSATTAGHGTGLSLPPGITRPADGALRGVVSDIRTALRSGAAPEDTLRMISGYLDEISSWESPGITADGIAGIIAAALARGDRPATAVYGALLGREIRLDAAGPHMRPAGEEEARFLRLRPGEEIYVREGVLRAGSIHCARVCLKLAWQRTVQLTSGTAWGRIRSGEPCGTVLASYGLVPGRRRVEVFPGGNPAVRAWRVSSVGASPVCVTTEDTGQDLCQRLATA